MKGTARPTRHFPTTQLVVFAECQDVVSDGGSDEARGWDPVGSSCDGTGKLHVRGNFMRSVKASIANGSCRPELS